MIDPGQNLIKPVEDTIAKMLALQGELTDDLAQATFAEFCYSNPSFFLELIAGIRLFPMQELVIKGWMRNSFNMAVWSRGMSKSFSLAAFCLIWSLFNPGNRIVLVSFAFRAARRNLEQIEAFVNHKDASLLKNCFPDDLQKRADQWKWILPNGASIICLPLGDGTKIRGIRADTLIIDEYGYLPENVIEEVLKPFLVAKSNITEMLKIREEEDAKIKRGQMSESERHVFEENMKVIALSSATFTFNHMFKKYKAWVDLIMKSEKTLDTSYFVSRLGYLSAPDGMLNLKIVEESKNSELSQAMFDREYNAIFSSDSGSYFSAKKMMECSVVDGQMPCVEITGEPGAKYVLAVDPSFSSGEHSDFFAMTLMKIVKSRDKEIGQVVHNYAVAGGNLKDHTLYLHYLLMYFNVVYIIIDSSGGDSNEFIASSNNSEVFKDQGIELKTIEADFKVDDYQAIVKEAKKSYNKTDNRIVQKQYFTTAYKKAGNEYLQACFDHHGMSFAGKAAATKDMLEMVKDMTLPIIKAHSYYADFSPSQFLEHQDYLIDLQRVECSMIEFKATSLGSFDWDIPNSEKKSKRPDRTRRDMYSTLFMSNFGVKLYLDIERFKQPERYSGFTPILI